MRLLEYRSAYRRCGSTASSDLRSRGAPTSRPSTESTLGRKDYAGVRRSARDDRGTPNPRDRLGSLPCDCSSEPTLKRPSAFRSQQSIAVHTDRPCSVPIMNLVRPAAGSYSRQTPPSSVSPFFSLSDSCSSGSWSFRISHLRGERDPKDRGVRKKCARFYQ